MPGDVKMIIKVCGVKDGDTAKAAVKAGATHIGLMMYKQSKRYIDVDKAKTISDIVKQSGGEPVAVFVDADAATMQMICEKTGINTVQLHGETSRLQHHKLPKTIQRIYVVKIDQSEIDKGVEYLNPERDLLLYDNSDGTGTTFNNPRFKNRTSFKFLIAGGLTPDNVGAIINKYQPNGVDVSTGVEGKSGEKSLELIESFISKLRGDSKINVRSN